MGRVLQLLRGERQVRFFFVAYAQSALGTGAAYVALVVLAYDRLSSPWAIALVLLADFVPPMLFGPVFGAAADRWSRKRCAIVADVVRTVAFLGIALVDSFGATVAFALLAGAGTGLFKPAVMAGLPSLVQERELPQATALYGVVTELGYTLGPALAALFLLFGGPEDLLALNALTFALSSLLLLRISFGERPELTPAERAARPSLLGETREGITATARMPGIRTLILATTAVLLFGGTINVAELLLAEDFGSGNVGYSLLVTASGIGIGLGSLLASKGGSLARLKRRYLVGLGLFGVGLAATGAAPALPVALVTLAAAGVGNGLAIVYERLIIQTVVPDHLLGRVFGVQYSLDGAAFGIAFLAGAAVLSLVGPRTVFLAAGAGAAAVCAISVVALRGAWRDDGPPEQPPPGAVPEQALTVGGGVESSR